ncbi:MAG: acyl-CoA thioesterase [Zoogloea sp.]|uniref:acyl-CoA thioesterase n=1 Tax=Zoogloea sp. TaxID=49181 RepID=UPI003F3A297A
MSLLPHQLSMTVVMTPDLSNYADQVQGGALLRLMDQAAYACASRYTAARVTTVCVDQTDFQDVVRVGELVTLLASVNFTDASSIEVGVKLVAEDYRTQTVRHVTSCFFTLTAMDEDGVPVLVHPLRPGSPDALRRYKAAQTRRRMRHEIREMYVRLHQGDVLEAAA